MSAENTEKPEKYLTVDDLIANVKISSEQTIDEAKARADFARYAKIVTTDTELSLDGELDDDAYRAQVRAILRKASYFCTIDSRAVATDSSDNYLKVVLDGLGAGDEDDGLTQAQQGEIRRFIDAAQADGKVTFEEIVDFLVLTDTMNDEGVPDLPRSSLAGARFCLEDNGIAPTEGRIQALARLAEAEADESEEDEVA